METDQAGDYTQVNATAKAWNTVTNEQVSLMQGPGVQLGSICAVTDTAVYVSMENTYRLANGLTETINGHCDCADGNLIYTSIYEDRSVLCYDETTGVTTNVTALSENEYVVGAADGYLYIHSGDSYRREKIRE